MGQIPSQHAEPRVHEGRSPASKRWYSSLVAAVVSATAVGMQTSFLFSTVAVPRAIATSDRTLLSASGGICPAQLATELEAIAQQPAFQRARWGILVQTLATPGGRAETLYAREAASYFIPASNVKLLTTAAALEQLGAQYQIRTSIIAETTETGAVHLRVVGRGDPSLTAADLQNLAQQVRQQGITQVRELVADDSFFQGAAVNPNWEWEDVQAGYGAPVNSLILAQNEIGLTLFPQALGQPLRVVWDEPTEAQRWQIQNQTRTVATEEPEFVAVGRDLSQPILQVSGQLRVGAAPETASVAVPDPARRFLDRLRQALVAEGVAIAQTHVETEPSDGGGTEIAAVASAPLAELLIPTNQDSKNLYAEALLRQLGVVANPDMATHSALEAGLAAIQTTLTTLDVNPESYVLADGSGLSRHNLVSPEALLQTLQAMHQSSDAAIYRNSLSVAGVNGTLRNRFQGTVVQGQLWGKTGAVSGNASLSGYFDPPHYAPLGISILVNQANQPGRVMRQAIDEMVLRLAQLRQC